jgi:hypothetical protein
VQVELGMAGLVRVLPLGVLGVRSRARQAS